MRINAVIFGRIKRDGERPIKIRVYHNAKTSYIDTGISVDPRYFDADKGVVIRHPNSQLMLEINEKIAILIAKYSQAAALLGEHCADMSALSLKNLILSYADSGSIPMAMAEISDFYDAAEHIIIGYELDGRHGSAENIRSVLSILHRYTNDRLLSFADIDVEFLKRLRRWYVPTFGKEVTFHKHLRGIKIIFNDARRRKLIPNDLYPFSYYRIPSTYDSEIRCHSAQTIYRISKLSGLGPDMFMLTFYMCGMNMVDLFNLPYSDDYVETKRSKTIRSAKPVKLRLKIHAKAREILARYPDPERKRLFHTSNKDHTTLLHQANKDLRKKVAAIGLGNVSILDSRHSWATIAGSLSIPDAVIDKGLMHAGQGIIEKYRQFDYSIVDRANEQVISHVFDQGEAT